MQARRTIMLFGFLFVVMMAGCSSSSTIKTIQGSLEEFIVTADSININYNDAVLVSGAELHGEIKINGAWIQFRTSSGQSYILRIIPPCRYYGDSLIIPLHKQRDVEVIETGVQKIGSMFANLMQKENRKGEDWMIIPTYSYEQRASKGERIPVYSQILIGDPGQYMPGAFARRQPHVSITGRLRNKKELYEELSNDSNEHLLKDFTEDALFMDVVELKLLIEKAPQ